MNKNFFFTSILVMVLVFGMSVVGCDDGSNDGGGETDTWTNVTSFSQVNGSWKAPSSYKGTTQGMTVSSTTNNYIITFNATAKTMSASGSVTATFSGGNINAIWPDMKEGLEYMNQQNGVTVTINDANHSYTVTYNNFSQALPDEELSQMGLKINQNGSKLKMEGDGTEVIYTKQ